MEDRGTKDFLGISERLKVVCGKIPCLESLTLYGLGISLQEIEMELPEDI